MLLGRQVLAGNGEPLLEGAQGQIVAGHLGAETHQQVAAAFHAAVKIRACRLDSAPHPAEEVHLPAGIKTHHIEVAGCGLAADGFR